MTKYQEVPQSEATPVKLEFDADLVSVVDGRVVAHALPVWLRIAPDNSFPRGRWICLRHRSSFFDDATRPLIRFETSDGRTIVEPMPGPILGAGEWIGYIPAATVTISVSPVGRPGPFAFGIDVVEILPRWQVLYHSLAFETSRMVAQLRERVFDAPDVVHRGLKLVRTMRPIADYHDWRLRLTRKVELDGIDRPRADWRSTPAFIFLFRLAGARVEAVEATIQSLRGQVYSRWTAYAVCDGADSALLRAYRDIAARDHRCLEIASESALAALPHATESDYLSLLDPGDTLPETSLAIVAETLARTGHVTLIYGDEDARARDGTFHTPRLKPDWSPIFQRSAPYLGRLAWIRPGHLIKSGCLSVAQFAADEMATLGTVCDALGSDQIHHVRRILYHRRAEISPARAAARAIMSNETPVADGEWPEVTIVIPTRDLADLLSQCADGLKRNTDYPRFRVVVMDNGSRQADAVALLDDLRRTPRFTVIDRPTPFNFSALSNEGARVTTSPLLVFLNNDIEMIDDQWLKALIPWAIRPEIGVVEQSSCFRAARSSMPASW